MDLKHSVSSQNPSAACLQLQGIDGPANHMISTMVLKQSLLMHGIVSRTAQSMPC
jgi:hypothetical protein